LTPHRVLMTTDAVGGVWTYALDLAHGLAKAGVAVSLAVLGPEPAPDQRRAAEAVPSLDLIETGLTLDWMAAEPAEIEEAAAAVRGLASRLGADLVHLNSPALAAGRAFSCPVLGACHSCLATWWTSVKDGEMPAAFRWRTRALWRGLVACDALLAPTHAFAEAVARTYDLPRPLVVHNGRGAQLAPPRVVREPIVFTSGRLWDEGKNAGVLDAAAALSGAQVLAAGPLRGPSGEHFQPRRLQPLGRLSSQDVSARLSNAAIFASSALYEPFGLGVLEAAQAGCALVLSDIATFRELWDGAALFADPRDPTAFADAFDGLLADPAETQRRGRLAQARAARFTASAMSEGVLQIYRSLSEASATPRRREATA
jgi:glycosyltransferase involved in cell wall biosynthesis